MILYSNVNTVSNDSPDNRTEDGTGPDRLIKCSEISDDSKRLACYDRIINEMQDAAPLPDQAPWASGWQFGEETFPADDDRIQYLSLRSDEQVNGSPLQLIIRHMLPRNQVILGSHFPFSPEEVPIHHRLDWCAPILNTWNRSQDLMHLVYPSPDGFIRSMLGKDTLMLHLHLETEALTLHFQISGLREAMEPSIRHDRESF